MPPSTTPLRIRKKSIQYQREGREDHDDELMIGYDDHHAFLPSAYFYPRPTSIAPSVFVDEDFFRLSASRRVPPT